MRMMFKRLMGITPPPKVRTPVGAEQRPVEAHSRPPSIIVGIDGEPIEKPAETQPVKHQE